MFQQVLGLLMECTEDIEGATVENNKFCVSVHYRNVDEEVLTSFLMLAQNREFFYIK